MLHTPRFRGLLSTSSEYANDSDFIRKTGIPRTTYYDVLGHKREANTRVIHYFLSALRVKFEYLFVEPSVLEAELESAA
ncbi:hypothetical protein ACFWGP_05640 [Agromyces sp. NPDC127015]|uniref:hypothetical protein n=1 Tax=Agromyces sp. NPDC127015 TaxID=3347108 RepID=UPI00366297F0